MAILSGFGHVNLPYDLVLLDQRLPIVFRIHMAASGLALVLIVTALLLRRHPSWHRPLGRFAAAAVVMGGLSAIPSALSSEASAFARAGFLVQGLVWLGLLAEGWRAIRSREIERHRHLMLTMAAVASGAIWLRLATSAAAVFAWPFAPTYAVAAWAAWLVPLTLTVRYVIAVKPATPAQPSTTIPSSRAPVSRKSAAALAKAGASR